jgi:5-methylcytosine-specific restriction endonuclease McrA
MAKKKHVYNKSTGRTYVYDKAYESSKTQKQHRAERNLARAEIKKHLTDKYGAKKAKAMLDGKDVDHIKPLKDGGKTTKKNIRILSVKKNRGRGN